MTIIGTGFIGASAVTFNGASASFTVDLSTRSPAKVPVGATDGPDRRDDARRVAGSEWTGRTRRVSFESA